MKSAMRERIINVTFQQPTTELASALMEKLIKYLNQIISYNAQRSKFVLSIFFAVALSSESPNQSKQLRIPRAQLASDDGVRA